MEDFMIIHQIKSAKNKGTVPIYQKLSLPVDNSNHFPEWLLYSTAGLPRFKNEKSGQFFSVIL